MNKNQISRRLFMIESGAGIGSAWLLSNLPEILAAQNHAHAAAQSPGTAKLEFFTPEQAVEVEAIAAQIIPTDSTPGAREARVIYFMDRALATFAADDRPSFLKGLKDLQSKVRKQFKKSNAERFSALTNDQQIKLLKSIEKSEFFELVRTMTIYGMFANPTYGGNHDEIGWKLIGFESQFVFEPPFGFYDRDDQANR
ncbi:MAG TPA: gluconate 2-dehydrogenase subunit 3 family protein [Blastocatellia bacterium]|nr:gluconate 2-dehydrogenase subunit 3 family protein [Blastocatellia bacterium]